MNSFTWLSGTAPMKPSTGRPSTKAYTVGMDCTRSCPANTGFLSTSILTSFTAPLAASTAFSSAGPSVLQGPHQVAQKSTITGVSCEASMTSLAKPASVPSLIRSPGAAVSPMSDIGPSLPFSKAQTWDGR